jgi:hypothetical protein
MTNRNLNSWLRKIFRNFICGFCLGVVMGILGIAKGAGYDPSILEIIIFALIFGLIFGAISAIFGRSFWQFISRKRSGLPKQTVQSINNNTNDNSIRQDSTTL